MRLPLLDAMHDQMRRETPELMRVFAPRRYVPPPGYANPRAYAPRAAAVCGAAVRNRNRAKTMVDVLQVCAYQLARYDVPTYFVAHDFGLAVMQTDPPPDVTVGQLEWPMPAMLFVLPESLSLKIWGRLVPFVIACKLPVGGIHPCDPLCKALPGVTNVIYDRASGGVAVHGMLMLGEQPVDYSMAASDQKTLKEVITDTRFTEDAYAEPLCNKIVTDAGLTDAEDVSIINKVTAFAFGMVMAMMAKPELVEYGSQQRRERVRDGVVARDGLWNPNVVGRAYRMPNDGLGDGTHVSPRTHWRRAHYRNQHHGKGRAQVKLVRIERVLVNANIAGGAE